MTKYKENVEWGEALTVSVGRAAQMLGISEYLARQMVKRGELPMIRFGRLVRIPKSRLIEKVNSSGMSETGRYKPDSN
jgi:excisionase family DNA binding protein